MKLGEKIFYVFIALVVLGGFMGTGLTLYAEEKMLVIGSSREPDTLDIHKTAWNDMPTALLHTPLVNMASTNGSLIPGLASKYVISNDGKIVTFHLRKNIKDANGNPITAGDYKFTYNRYIAPETKSPSADLILNKIKETKVVDDFTLQLIYDKAYGPLLTFLASQAAGVVNKTYFERVGEVNYGQKPLGTGLYYAKEWVRGSHIDYIKNPHYQAAYNPDPQITNKTPPGIEKIRYRIIPEAFTLVSEIKSGNVDLLLDVPPEYYKELKNNPAVTMQSYSEAVLRYIGFNCKRPPFDDVRIRQAIAMAIDREAIVEYGAEGLATSVYGPLAPTMNGYSEAMETYAKKRYPYDLKKAAQLLAEAGWKDSDGDGIVDKNGVPFKATLWVNNEGNQDSKIATIVQDQLSKIGLKFEMQMIEGSSFTAQVSKGDHQMYILRYGLIDAQILYYMFRSEFGVKRMFYYTPDLDAALDDMGTIVDPKKRQKAIERAGKLLVDGSPLVPLFARKVFIAYRNDKVAGIKLNSFSQSVMLDDAYLK